MFIITVVPFKRPKTGVILYLHGYDSLNTLITGKKKPFSSENPEVILILNRIFRTASLSSFFLLLNLNYLLNLISYFSKLLYTSAYPISSNHFLNV